MLIWLTGGGCLASLISTVFMAAGVPLLWSCAAAGQRPKDGKPVYRSLVLISEHTRSGASIWALSVQELCVCGAYLVGERPRGAPIAFEKCKHSSSEPRTRVTQCQAGSL